MRQGIRAGLATAGAVLLAGMTVSTATAENASVTTLAPVGLQPLSEEVAHETMEDLRYQLDLDVAAGDVQVYEDGTIIQTIGDQTARLAQDGSWSIGDTPPEGATTAAAWISGCVGEFHTVQRVSDYIQSGATQTCTEGAYPHWISIQLKSSCAGGPCIIFSPESGKVRSTNGLGFNRVANATYTETCLSTRHRTYQQTVWPAGKGVEFGPMVDTDEPVVHCDLNAY